MKRKRERGRKRKRRRNRVGRTRAGKKRAWLKKWTSVPRIAYIYNIANGF